MISIEEIKDILSKKLTHKRFKHSLGVYETTLELSKLYKVCEQKAGIAGLLHDYAKDLSYIQVRNYIDKYSINMDKVIEEQLDLVHGYIGAELVKEELNIYDEEILNAIRYHTIGKENMSKLEKIVYLSDYIEPNRVFPGVEELRKIALSDLDKATLLALNNTISYVIESNKLIHINSILARNSLILKIDNPNNR